MTLTEIYIPEGADEAMEWAATKEFDLRYRRSQLQREGLNETINKATRALHNFGAVFSGDPSVPELREPGRVRSF